MLTPWSSKRCFWRTTYANARSSSIPRNEGLSKWRTHLRRKSRTQGSHGNGTRWWVTGKMRYACMSLVIRVGRTSGSRRWLMLKKGLHRCLKRRTIHKVGWRMKTMLESSRKSRRKHRLPAVKRLLHGQHWRYAEPRRRVTQMRIHYAEIMFLQTLSKLALNVSAPVTTID